MTDQIRMLFVDDEKNVLRSLRRIFFEEPRYEIITADSAEAGLETLEKIDNIRLVMADYRMPGMDGVTFLKKVYENWPKTIRMVLSGYADTGMVVEAINQGQIFKFVPKPWRDQELFNDIAIAIKHQDMQRKNLLLNQELKEKNLQLTELNEELEKKVSERTLSLEIRNQVLQVSQNVLDSLPVGVVGIDSNDTIVQCNTTAFTILSSYAPIVLGENRSSTLPTEINSLINRTSTESQCREKIIIHNKTCRVIAKRLENLPSGIVLTLIPDNLF